MVPVPMRMRSIVLFLGAVSLSACYITPPKPPPSTMFEMGDMRTPIVDYRESEAPICAAEPRWLVDEIMNVNNVLDRFLDRTDPSRALTWTDGQRSLAIDGRAMLPDLVDVHVSNLQLLSKCGIANWQSLPRLRERGLELSAAVTERLPQISLVLEYIDAQVVLEAWDADYATRKQRAESIGCQSRGTSEEIYYAQLSADGVTQWYFCNGALVSRRAGSEPDFTPPRGARRVRSSDYMRKAREFPTENIVVAPVMPPVPAALADKLPASG